MKICKVCSERFDWDYIVKVALEYGKEVLVCEGCAGDVATALFTTRKVSLESGKDGTVTIVVIRL